MITQTADPQRLIEKAHQIRTYVPQVLAHWGLSPKFARWRLTQDPLTNLVVLFGVLNDIYITAHTSALAKDYFNPRLLHDLAQIIQVQVIASIHEGFRYAFILDRGQLGPLPSHLNSFGLEPRPLVENNFYSAEPGALMWSQPIIMIAPSFFNPLPAPQRGALMAQVEAEVERRWLQSAYPLNDSLNSHEPNATQLMKSRAKFLTRIHLILDESSD